MASRYWKTNYRKAKRKMGKAFPKRIARKATRSRRNKPSFGRRRRGR